MTNEAYDELLETLLWFSFQDEEGEPALFSGLPGVLEEEIQEWEQKQGFRLPPDYRKFVLRWDGADLGSVELAHHDAWGMIEKGLLALHPWANGDFDCIDLKREGFGRVIFLSRESSERPVIAASFADWLAAVLKELKTHGTLLHPYLDQRNGFYRRAIGNVLQKTTIRQVEPSGWIYRFFGLFGLRHGTLTWRYASGARKKEAVYRAGKLKRETHWHENGVKSMETHLIAEDVPHGVQRMWYSDGREKGRQEFERGHLHGEERLWDPQGRLITRKIWRYSKLQEETSYDWVRRTVREARYADKEGQRTVLETAERPMTAADSAQP